MWMDMVRAKLGEQREVYAALKKGDGSMVCYKEFKNGTWGTDDANYTNRLRLACYLLYFHVEDEEAVSWLFKEELKDRDEFQKLPASSMYGNLYKKGIAAARAHGDPYWEELEQRYKREFPMLFEKN